ncbi:hypothetical protein ACJX0J_028187, partial [Zea mays]
DNKCGVIKYSIYYKTLLNYNYLYFTYLQVIKTLQILVNNKYKLQVTQTNSGKLEIHRTQGNIICTISCTKSVLKQASVPNLLVLHHVVQGIHESLPREPGTVDYNIAHLNPLQTYLWQPNFQI